AGRVLRRVRADDRRAAHGDRDGEDRRRVLLARQDGVPRPARLAPGGGRADVGRPRAAALRARLGARPPRSPGGRSRRVARRRPQQDLALLRAKAELTAEDAEGHRETYDLRVPLCPLWLISYGRTTSRIGFPSLLASRSTPRATSSSGIT